MLTRQEIGQLEPSDQRELLRHYEKVQKKLREAGTLSEDLKNPRLTSLINDALDPVNTMVRNIRGVLRINQKET